MHFFISGFVLLPFMRNFPAGKLKSRRDFPSAFRPVRNCQMRRMPVFARFHGPDQCPSVDRRLDPRGNVLLVWFTLLCLCHRAHAPFGQPAGVDPIPNGVAAGEVTASSAILWTRTLNVGPVVFTVSRDADFGTTNSVWGADVADASIPVKVALTDLNDATTYYYRVTDVSGASAVGRFRTAAKPGKFHGLRFGVSGDWHGELAPYPSVANAVKRDLQFFAALGDTIYADYPSPAVPKVPITAVEEFRAKYNEVYSEKFGNNGLTNLRGSTAFFAVIDDHEVINDFAGGALAQSDSRFDTNGVFINETKLYRSALQAFEEYHPLVVEPYHTPEDLRTHLKPKLYRTQVYGDDAAIFLLDTRSFRDKELPGVLNPFDTAGARRFSATAFDLDPDTGEAGPRRTLLGAAQLSDLKADLLRAKQAGVLWKFILLGEPIQNLGFADASDRFEGYARERTELLQFLNDNGIRNVVFVSADIHGTVVNNVSYQKAPEQPLIPTGSFEVVTGAVAHDKPFGPTTFDVAAEIKVLPGLTLLGGLLRYVEVPDRATFDGLPLAERDRLFQRIMDVQLDALDLDTTGLEGSDVQATLLQGNYVAAHTYGWTEFEIDRDTHWLSVTTYGITPYSAEQVEPAILQRVPEIVSRFIVLPQSEAPGFPALRAAHAGKQIEIRWPVWGEQFVLQSWTGLSDATWTDMADEPSRQADDYVVTLQSGSDALFFRLRHR